MGGKKLWSIGRAVLYMVKKGLTKSKLTHHLHHMLRRSNTRASRFEYEFSCSNSPVYPDLFSKLKPSRRKKRSCYNPKDADRVVQKVFELLNQYDVGPLSPAIELPGFGGTPPARQLRVTDSPYSEEALVENLEVDKEAEDFINQFYERLKQESWLVKP